MSVNATEMLEQHLANNQQQIVYITAYIMQLSTNIPLIKDKGVKAGILKQIAQQKRALKRHVMYVAKLQQTLLISKKNSAVIV